MRNTFLITLAVLAAGSSVRSQTASKPTPAAIERAASNAKPAGHAELRTRARVSRAYSGSLPVAPLVAGADSCTAPDVIVGTGSFAFDNTLATTGVDGQNETLCDLASAGTAILNDVWFTWNAPSSGLARVTTCAMTGVDTKIAVYPVNTCPVSGSSIACNDDACAGLQSALEFACTGGADYLIQLGNYPGQFPPALPGSGSFDLAVLATPSNDDCSTPQAVLGLTSVSFDDWLATAGSQGQSEGACFAFGSTGIQRDLWYSWTATISGTASLRTCGSALDTKIAVYDGTGCPAAGAIGCNDDACGLQSRVDFACTSGQPYTFQIGLYSGTNAGGAGTFEVSATVPPANDGCASASAIGGAGPFAFDVTDATTGSEGQAEAQCNAPGGTAIHSDLWYAWTAPASGTFAVQDVGLTAVDTKIAVYDGAGCPSATSIACNDDAGEPNSVYLQSRAVFTAVAGNVYTIQLGVSAASYGGGPGEFTIRPAVAPSNDACTAPVVLAGAGPFTFDDSNATTGAEGQSDSACGAFGSSAVAQDVWYAWTATTNGTATLSTCDTTTVDTKVAVYAGAGCPIAGALACNDDACGPVGYQSQLVFPIVCGQVYTVQIGTYPLYSAPAGGEGRFTIDAAGSGTCAPGTVVCAGDGLAPHTGCPCGNDSAPAAAAGCLNSLGSAGSLRAAGSASVSADTVVLQGAQMTNGAALYFQGTLQVNGGNGAAFGDGLRCAGGTIVRLGLETNTSGASQYPSSGEAPVAVRGLVPASGAVRTYQCWYRNAATFCTSSTFNLTNGLEIVWQP